MKKPDWKNEGDYEHVTIETIGADGVAWEFLRRNQKYQGDYAALKSGTVTDAKGNPPVAVEHGIILHAPEQGFFVPRLKPNETQRAWRQRCLSTEMLPRILSPSRYLSKKWKLKTICDPNKSSSELDVRPSFIAPQHPRIIFKFDDLDELETVINPAEDEESGGQTLLSPNNIVVAFSLNEKITPQWKRIKEKLVAWQTDYSKSDVSKGTSSPKPKAWIPALRAWDSYLFAPELPNSQRAAILYGENDWEDVSKFHSHLKTATRLITRDYVEIARRGW